ncbi:hypothetical protein K7T73_12910 [Bacillus badius]|uniref:hypothetical protein n=1 Tax=Bacillus badius TaxID=1455 RepID=UPI001CBC21AE|nr:hypothetical protein [Bacillus badius]UAT29500.1 hypothetical protein K7T73_12910 [Bacillus badius]
MNDLIGIGRISAIYPERGTAKVYREDKGVVTGELIIMKRGDLWEPQVGDMVLCVFLPRSSAGYILGG